MTEENSELDPSLVLDAVQQEKSRLKDQVSQLQLEKDQALNEAKQPILDFLLKESRGAYTREDLQKLDLETLKKLKTLFVDAVETGYKDILSKRQVARDSEKKPHGTVGTYNQETEEFEEGI